MGSGQWIVLILTNGFFDKKPKGSGKNEATSVQEKLLAAELGVEDVVVHIEPKVEDR